MSGVRTRVSVVENVVIRSFKRERCGRQAGDCIADIGREHSAATEVTSRTMWITAVQFDGSGHETHEHIRAVRWRDPGSDEQGQSTVAEVVDLIRAQTLLYVSDDAFGRTALVRVVDAKPAYIRSWARGEWGNDLLTLPRFDG
jgi:hypothetical protein